MDCSLQKQGRKRKQEEREDNAFVIYFAKEHNGGANVDEVDYKGETRWLFHCASCEHFRYMTCHGFERAVKEAVERGKGGFLA